MADTKPAVVLLSGGIDSATTCAVAKSEGYDIYALSFDYGQRHHIELKAASSIAIEVYRHWRLGRPLAAAEDAVS